MDRAVGQVSMTLDSGAFKASIGILAIVAAAAAGSGTAMTASLFGALAALALSAGAALFALLELAACDRNRVWRTIGWGALVPGWIAFAAMLVHAPLSYLDGLRVLATVLLASGAALRVWRWRAQMGAASPGVVVAAGFALMALGVTWSGVWAPFGDSPLTAIGIAAALELCGTGSVWLMEASMQRPTRDPATARTAVGAQAAMQMA
jgi:hypothetical protein